MKKSSGIAVFKRNPFRIFLVKPGGPFWSSKPDTDRVWSFPKGEVEPNEPIKEAAIREFKEETGYDVSDYASNFILLGSQVSKHKEIFIWAVNIESFPEDLQVKSNSIEIEYPPRSNKFINIPEIEKGKFHLLTTAENIIFKNQLSFISKISQL